MNTPLINGLKRYADENNIRFHMPGHKGKNLGIDWGELIPKLDVTEVEGTDNLQKPSSIILESQELAAKAFGAKQTFYSVNGTTGGIYAAIASVTKPGDKVLVQRDCHKSVYNALILGNLRPKFIFPTYSAIDNILTGINPGDIENELKADNNIKAVVITYPTYYGICSDIKKIVQIVHKYNKILIVDEAHGSHFVFNKKLPLSALEAGADITVQSSHKTLPALTQSSMVHVGSNRVNIDKLQHMLSVYQTTSPSYMLMASLDFARAYMEQKGKEDLDSLLDNIEKATSYLKGFEDIRIFDKDNIRENNFCDFDPTKILIGIKGISGKHLDYMLRERYNIQLEMADNYYGLALTSIKDNTEEIYRLVSAVEDISKNNKNNDGSLTSTDIRNIKPQESISISDAFHSDTTYIKLKESMGRISGGFIIPYPPGIPIVCPGEMITRELIEYIDLLKKNGIEVLGLEDNVEEKIKVIN